MKFLKTIVLLLIFSSGNLLLVAQQDKEVIDQVIQAMKTANSNKLSSFFHTTLDLEAGDTDGNFSKDQSKMILQEFFTKNPVKSFTTKHQGSSDDGSKYIIGSYITKSNAEYRVYILLKSSNAGLRIHQIQFEAD